MQYFITGLCHLQITLQYNEYNNALQNFLWSLVL